MQALCADTAIKVVGITLIPIVHQKISAHRDGGHLWLQADKEAVAVLICQDGTSQLLDVNGTALSLEKWLSRVDGLEPALQACGFTGDK
jgi:hypothetical protein